MSDDTTLNFTLGIDDVDHHLDQTRRYLVGDMLRKNARIRPEQPAVVGEQRQEVSYGELDARVNALANALLERGLDHGSTVAILSENRPEFVEVIYAGAKLGALVPTMNWRQEETELIHCLDLVDPDAIVISGNQKERYEWIRASELGPDVISLDGVEWGSDYESLIESGETTEPSPSRSPNAEDGVTVFYTSGTTGFPKGTVISHRAMVNRAIAWKLVAGVGPDFIAWPPMFHMVATEQLFSVAMDGGSYYTVDGFEPEILLERASTADPGYLPLLPGVVQPLLETAEAEGYGPDDFEGIDYIGAMADLVSASNLQAVTELFDAEYVNTFGSTELGAPPLSGNTIPAGTYPTKDDLSKTEGPLCDVKLIDEEWNEVERGEYGELAVRGPTLFSGYVGNTEANESEFQDGWFRTGDMFVMNEDGSYDFIDRRKYLIKSGGENIYPAEIERILMDQNEIEEAVVVREPDDEWGEVPKAYIALAEGASMDREEVLDRLEGEIARYKFPHYVEFVDHEVFPRSTTGKVVRGDIEEWEVSSGERIRNP